MSKDYAFGYIDPKDYDEYLVLSGTTLQDVIQQNFNTAISKKLFKVQTVKRKVTDYHKLVEDYSGDRHNWCIKCNIGFNSGITLVDSNNVSHNITKDELDKYREEKTFTEYSFPFKRVEIDDYFWYDISEKVSEYVHQFTNYYNVLSLDDLEIDVTNQYDLALYGLIAYCVHNNKIPILEYI